MTVKYKIKRTGMDNEIIEKSAPEAVGPALEASDVFQSNNTGFTSQIHIEELTVKERVRDILDFIREKWDKQDKTKRGVQGCLTTPDIQALRRALTNIQNHLESQSDD